MDKASARPTVTPCPAEVRLADGSSLSATFWLLPDPGRPSGVESIDRLLEGIRQFLAVGLPGGGSTLLRRDAIRTLEISSDGSGAPDAAADGASLDVLTLHLETGESVSGILQAVAPPGGERMSDIFNGPDRFVRLGLGSRILFVHKASIVRVGF